MKTKSLLNISCKNSNCKDFGKKYTGRIIVSGTYKVFNGTKTRRMYQCTQCGEIFSETKGTPYYYLKKKPEEINNVLEHHCRSVGIRDTSELLGMSKDTIERIIYRFGMHLWDWYENQAFQLPTGHIEYDELWTFVYQKHSDEIDQGDIWIWLSFHRESRFLIYAVIGKHTKENGYELVKETKRYLTHPSYHCSDELPSYIDVFRKSYGEKIIPEKTGQRGRPRIPYYSINEKLDYSQVHKTRQEGRIVSVQKNDIFGETPKGEISTSLIERQNLNVREDMSRTTRKTLRFSKDILYLMASCWIYFFHYNFRRPHGGLKKRRTDYNSLEDRKKWIERTPAMAAGLTDRPIEWDVPFQWSSGYI